MSFYAIILLVAFAALVNRCIAGYTLEDDYSADNFFSMFEFFTSADPTHGFVNYVDQGTAQSDGLISTNNGAVVMGVDHTNIAPTGRNSVRLTSTKAYNHGLILLDVAHMPEGCGTWPAFWMVGPSWPSNGEIDIIEGVNDQTQNAMTLHTGPGCSITNNGLFSGTIATPSCDVNAAGQAANAGCSIDAPSSNTYGSGLNAVDGGVYATEWNSDGISVYFFPRSSIPSDITSGNPSPSGWGKPLAQFQGGCDIDSSFKDQQIVFDTTFCGDWAGNVWDASPTCSAQASSCEDFVANNPAAFANAYWEVNSLKVFQSNGDDITSPVTSVGDGPTGIASGLPSIISSLAPIPVSTQDIQTTFAVSVTPTTSATLVAPTSSVKSTSSVTSVASTPSATPTTSAVSVTTISSATSVTSTPSATLVPLSQWGDWSQANGGFDVASSTSVSSSAPTSATSPTTSAFSAPQISSSSEPAVQISSWAIAFPASSSKIAATSTSALVTATSTIAIPASSSEVAATSTSALVTATSTIVPDTVPSSTTLCTKTAAATPSATLQPLDTSFFPSPSDSSSGNGQFSGEQYNGPHRTPAAEEIQYGTGKDAYWGIGPGDTVQTKRDDNMTDIEDRAVDSAFPVYPNGSSRNAADIRNKERRRMHARHLLKHVRRSGHVH